MYVRCLKRLNCVGGSLVLRTYATISRFMPVKSQSRSFSSSIARDSVHESQNAQDRKKVRRAYAMGGCLVMMWMSTHAILLYKRRNEFRFLNGNLPPIEWDKFQDEYLAKGIVKTVIFQPHFEVANVYLHNPTERLLKKQLLDYVHTAPDKFTRPPDVRVIFEGSAKEARQAFEEAFQRNQSNDGRTLDFELDEFPSYSELAFVLSASVFTMAAIALVK